MSIALSSLVRIRPQFSRSVHLERDFYGNTSLSGYVLTTAARTTLQRIVAGMTTPGGTRAWTLTGPYGTGKSAFSLFLSNLLFQDEGPGAQGKLLLKAEEPDLYKQLFDGRRRTALSRKPFLPILSTGAREPIARGVLRGLMGGLSCFDSRGARQEMKAAQDLLERCSEKPVSSREVLELIERTAARLHREDAIGGVLLVLDELGKNLEYAVLHPARGDLYLLQDLAEWAQHTSKVPVLVIALLHQAFERYAEQLSPLERAEWAKVQGRFEDVIFQESSEQILRLIAQAVEFCGSEQSRRGWLESARRLARAAASLVGTPPGLTEAEFVTLLQGVFPLHPVVALLLGPLFRRLAQNERSLFAFLSAHEPHGFQEFLLTRRWRPEDPEIYTLDMLYDYLVGALGGSLYATPAGRRWAEVETALERLSAGGETARRLVKAVGVLQIIGELGRLKPSLDVLSCSLGLSSESLLPLLRDLCRQSVLIYRSFQGAYGLWEGSDFDLEEQLREARRHTEQEAGVAELLRKEHPIRPVVARRHSHQKGTLRYFEIRYADVHDFQYMTGPPQDSDGAVILVFPANVEEEKQLREAALKLSEPRLLTCIPTGWVKLHGYVRDMAALRWLLKSRIELAGDAVARREVLSRLADLQQAVQAYLDSIIENSTGEARWYHCGQEVSLPSRRAFTEYLSTVCDQVFSSTPSIPNELIARRYLSSAAAAARRSLIEAMLKSPDQPNLGLKGHPPEQSIYRALLAVPGLHREENGQWGFYPPPATAEPAMFSLWEQMEEFLRSADGKRRAVSDLFQVLEAPPYGLKAGPLPILLCALLLCHEAEVAIYEDGVFVPRLSIAHFERLMKSPHKFEVQRCRVAGVRNAVYRRLLATLPLAALGDDQARNELMQLVRPLIHLAADLPLYARRTRNLTELANRVRHALFNARDPEKLVFVDLPEACGCPPFLTEELSDEGRVDLFVTRLRRALDELQNLYRALLDDIEERILDGFGLRQCAGKAREELVKRALPVKSLAVDGELKSFLLRLCDSDLDHQLWLESLGSVLVGKPPSSWLDSDRAAFELKLHQMSRSFRNLEALALEVQGLQGNPLAFEGEALRLGITRLRDQERERVLRVAPRDQGRVAELEQRLIKLLEGSAERPELQLAALASAALHLMLQTEQPQGPAKPEQLRLNV